MDPGSIYRRPDGCSEVLTGDGWQLAEQDSWFLDQDTLRRNVPNFPLWTLLALGLVLWLHYAATDRVLGRMDRGEAADTGGKTSATVPTSGDDGAAA